MYSDWQVVRVDSYLHAYDHAGLYACILYKVSVGSMTGWWQPLVVFSQGYCSTWQVSGDYRRWAIASSHTLGRVWLAGVRWCLRTGCLAHCTGGTECHGHRQRAAAGHLGLRQSYVCVC